MNGSEDNRTVKVAFFAMHADDDRATGTFCVLPAERGAEYGIDGTVFPPSSAKLYGAFYRRKSRGWQTRALLYWYLVVFPRRLLHLMRATQYDAIFVQRSMFRWKSLPLLEWVAVKVLRKPLAYHMDDGIYLAARRRWSVWRCALADPVVTGNDLITEFAREAGSRVAHIEYALDASDYPVKKHEAGRPVVIGYIGIYPEDHLAPIATALREVCEATPARIEVVGGLRRPSIPELDPYLDWRAWDTGAESMNLANFDIGIMPLENTELHRTKEPLKIKEYMAAGIPVVVSPVGHNLRVVTDGAEGYFAGTPEEWRRRLTELVEDVGLRARLGGAGRALVLEKYDLPRLLEQLGDLFREMTSDEPPADPLIRP